jgi:hypothetical protein
MNWFCRFEIESLFMLMLHTKRRRGLQYRLNDYPTLCLVDELSILSEVKFLQFDRNFTVSELNVRNKGHFMRGPNIDQGFVNENL